MPPTDPADSSKSWTRVAGLGFELAAAVGGFALFGWWIGDWLGNAKIGLLVGAVLGIVGGLYNLVRTSLIALGEESGREHDKES
ncbi:MAG: AtpZ/AtpI family protein [Thermoanaerobaculia bacterium]